MRKHEELFSHRNKKCECFKKTVEVPVEWLEGLIKSADLLGKTMGLTTIERMEALQLLLGHIDSAKSLIEWYERI